MAEQRSDRFTEVEDRYAGYQVYDRNYDKIGKVDDLFVDDRDEPEYVGVKMGFLGSRATLIPFELVRVNDSRSVMEVAADKQLVQDGPSFDDDQEISLEFEERVYRHYGLDLSELETDTTEPDPAASTTAGYEPYYASSSSDSADTSDTNESAGTDSATSGSATSGSAGNAGPGMSMGDRDEGGGLHEHPPEDEGAGESESDLDDEDELRVDRTEEELRTSKREREAGSVNVRKRVRTDRERMTVPKRRERVKVDRVSTSGEASESEIGEDEVSMPVTEEEVQTEKRAVKKEEIRVSKEPEEEEEVVEEDLRKEEVDVDDETERGGGTER